MQKQHSLASLFHYATCALFAVAVLANSQAEETKVDPTGTWTWSTPGRDGGEGRRSTLKLKKENDKWAGVLVAPGRQGETREIPVEEIKVKGDELAFVVVREFGGNRFTAKYNGKIAGDTIKGKIELPGRDGNTRSVDWIAKRVPVTN